MGHTERAHPPHSCQDALIPTEHWHMKAVSTALCFSSSCSQGEALPEKLLGQPNATPGEPAHNQEQELSSLSFLCYSSSRGLTGSELSCRHSELLCQAPLSCLGGWLRGNIAGWALGVPEVMKKMKGCSWLHAAIPRATAHCTNSPSCALTWFNFQQSTIYRKRKLKKLKWVWDWLGSLQHRHSSGQKWQNPFVTKEIWKCW